MAERDLTAGQKAALVDGEVYPALFFAGEFETFGSPSTASTLRLWSGNGSITVGSDTYLGNSRLLAISPVRETTEIRATGFSVTLQGMLEADVQRALNAVRQGRRGTLSLGLFTAAGALIDDLIPLQVGKLDVSVVAAGADACTVGIQYESELVLLEVPGDRRYTAEDQKLDDATDAGFDLVPKLQDMDVIWKQPVFDVGTPPA